jgi:hypothetical protein
MARKGFDWLLGFLEKTQYDWFLDRKLVDMAISNQCKKMGSVDLYLNQDR